MEAIWYFIINPMAGGGKPLSAWPAMSESLKEAGIKHEAVFTEGRHHATQLAKSAIEQGYRRICGVGGDGTNHEIINGLMHQQVVPSADVLYSLFPMGRGNDWARTYGLSSDFSTFLSKIRQERTAMQDIGLASYTSGSGASAQRYFGNVAGMAYDAFVVQQSEKLPSTRAEWHYLWMIARCLFKYQLKKATIRFGNETVTDRFYTINIGICKYSGGGMQFVPHAVPNDGLLALTFARALSKFEVLLQTPKFYKGTILSHPKVSGAQCLEVSVTHDTHDQPTWIEADGELLGHTPVTISIIKNALRVAY